VVLISILLALFLCLKEYLHYKERADLYDRLMSKDITEYKNIDSAPPKMIKSKFSRSKGGENE
jgi:hypothetical protein